MKYVNYSYKLDEIIEEMKTSINNIDSICHHQNDVVEKLGDDEKFKDFVEGLKSSTEKYEEQKRVITHRLDCLIKIKTLLDSEDIEYIVSMLFEGLGVVNQDGKTIEEREKNKEEIKNLRL